MTLYHVSPKKIPINQRLHPDRARNRLKAIWLASRGQIAWAVRHVAQRHDVALVYLYIVEPGPCTVRRAGIYYSFSPANIYARLGPFSLPDPLPTAAASREALSRIVVECLATLERSRQRRRSMPNTSIVRRRRALGASRVVRPATRSHRQHPNAGKKRQATASRSGVLPKV